MEIVVEIGNEEEKQLVEQELAMFKVLDEEINFSTRLSRIIIAADFDRTVNKINNSTTYHSARGAGDTQTVAMAKILSTQDGIVLVVSPQLFTEEHDSLTRYIYYFHEMTHIAFMQNDKPLPDVWNREAYLKTSIGTMYEEYYCDRRAYTLLYSYLEYTGWPRSERYNNLLKNMDAGFKTLLNDIIYYQKLREEIVKFRLGLISVNQYAQNIRPIFDPVVISIAHWFALYHHHPNSFARLDFKKSHFIDESTFALAEYFKSKFEDEKGDTIDGLQLMEEVMKLFGVQWEDMPDGSLYLHVLDV